MVPVECSETAREVARLVGRTVSGDDPLAVTLTDQVVCIPWADWDRYRVLGLFGIAVLVVVVFCVVALVVVNASE